MATLQGYTKRDHGAVAAAALLVGQGLSPPPTLIKGLFVISPTLSPAIVAANTVAAQAVTVNGVAVGDIILNVTKPTEQAGLGLLGGRVSAANTVQLSFVNATGAGITPTASEVYKFTVIRV